MRTLILILVGLALAALAQWLAKPGKRLWAFVIFSGVWLLAVLWNLSTGLSHGYSLQEEAPIQALIFAVPVLLSGWLAWRSKRK